MASSEYVSWPAAGLHPGTDEAYPGWGRVAPGASTVHSPRGSVWEEVTDDDLRSRVTGLVDQARPILAAPVPASQIAPGPLDEDAARSLAFGVQRHLRVEASQVVAGTGTFDDAVIQRLWARIVTAEEGRFLRLQADNLAVGAVDGQVITGATVRTAASGPRTQMDSTGITVWDADGIASRMSPEISSGLALRDPRTGRLTPVSETIFGAHGQTWYGKSETHDRQPIPGIREYVKHPFIVPAPATGRLVATATTDFNTGAKAPQWRWMRLAAISAGTTYDNIIVDYQYRHSGWDSDLATVSGLLSGLPTSGEITIQMEVWFGSGRGTAPFSQWGTSFATLMVIPA